MKNLILLVIFAVLNVCGNHHASAQKKFDVKNTEAMLISVAMSEICA
jgi:hypothetical protein